MKITLIKFADIDFFVIEVGVMFIKFSLFQ